MEITISRSAGIRWLGIAFTILLVGASVFYLMQSGMLAGWLHSSDAPKEEMPPLSAIVAENGVETFYTLDYTETADTWLARLCIQSTETGCNYAEYLIAPSITTLLQTTQPQTGCTANSIQMVDFGDHPEDGAGMAWDWEIWKVHLALDAPWEGVDKEQDVYVFVSTSEGEWKFDHILFGEEAAKYVEVTQ